MKICIIGGVAGGASAAARLRRLDETAEIILFEKGPYISYANCGLPYYVGGTIPSQDQLIVTKSELLEKRFHIDVRTQQEVAFIQRDSKTLQVKNLITGETYEESYDKLLLSPGAAPKMMFPDAASYPGVFTLRTVPDAVKIKEYVTQTNPTSAVVVGGGFIGIEMAENLAHQGLSVTIIEFANHIVASLDWEMANLLHRHLQEKGIRLLLQTGVSSIVKSPDGLHLTLSDHTTLDTNLVLLSVGVAPESGLAKSSGLTLGIRDSIAVNEFLQTSDPDIYAVGDAIQVQQGTTGSDTLIPLAGPANRQGRTAALNMLGNTHPEEGNKSFGSAVLKVFDLTAASTGLSEAQCKAAGIHCLKTYVHPFSHATYYPGATQMSLKVIFTPEGKLLGAQAIGYEGVEKRIDVIATALQLGANVQSLQNLELCYAPPFSSAKDPVNMAGFTAANILSGSMPIWYAEEFSSLDLSKITLLDVSFSEEVLMGTLPGSINIPLDELRDRIQELDPAKEVYLTCRIGLRGYVAARILLQKGYQVKNLSGGLKTFSLIQEQKKLYQPTGQAPSSDSAKEKTLKQSSANILEVNACGLQCPGPIMKVSQGMKELSDGDQLLIHATDPAFASDVNVWCQRTGNTFVHMDSQMGTFHVTLQKGSQNPDSPQTPPPSQGNDKSMVVFSGDLDKAIASFIIANGAAAMGRKVTMFFTFWGLNILRKPKKISLKKSPVEKMFSAMMPRGSKKLGLSRMNMGGMGAKMIRGIMKDKNVSSLEELMTSAMDQGVRIVACQMSMDLMGIRQEELIDGVEIGGVATFLGSAETSDTNLFI